MLLLLAVAFGALSAACGNGAEGVRVRIDGLVIQAEVAQTLQERTQGLSGRPSLPEDGGMLFLFPEEGQPALWMHEMRFPLDFIWISRDLHVVDLTEDVPAPDPGVADPLPRYQPAAPVLYVLEVNAGVVHETGVQIGDAVTFEPGITPESAR